MSSRPNDEVLSLLRTLVAGQREILTRLARLEDARTPNAAAANLLRAIRPSVDDTSDRPIFAVRELLAHAELAAPEGEALRAAIIDAVGAMNGRKLGKFLARINGRVIEGLSVEQVGEDRGSAVWMLRVFDL